MNLDTIATVPVETPMETMKVIPIRIPLIPTAAIASGPILPTYIISTMLKVSCNKLPAIIGSARYHKFLTILPFVKSLASFLKTVFPPGKWQGGKRARRQGNFVL
jgi:hypothetical protein